MKISKLTSYAKINLDLKIKYYDKIISLTDINKAYKDYALILKITNSPNIKNLSLIHI